MRPRPAEKFETIEAGLVLRSVGYKGVPLAGLPFLDRRGIVPNDGGRVMDPQGQQVTGVYVSGWIKRGPTGLIGTNKADAKETVASMLADLEKGFAGQPGRCEPRQHGTATQRPRNSVYVSYEQWQDIDRLEMARGMPDGRPRVKFTKREEIFEALDVLEPPGE